MTELALTDDPSLPPRDPNEAPAPIGRARLPLRELLGVAFQGLRTRKLRAALSALGIAIGIGAMVAVVGVSSSAQANLIAEIDSLGTNLLTVSPGTDFLGNAAVLAPSSVPMIKHMLNVESDAPIYQLSNANVYRTPFVPSRADRRHRGRRGQRQSAQGRRHYAGVRALPRRGQPAVPGGRARQPRLRRRCRSRRQAGHVMLYIGNQWFVVVGILNPVKLDSSLDSVGVHLTADGREDLPGSCPSPARSTSAVPRTT